MRQVHKDSLGWRIDSGIRRYLTREDAETVAGALHAGFIEAETDREVEAALKIMALIEAQGGPKS